MSPTTGQLYPSVELARAAGVENPVEMVGRPEDFESIAAAVRDQARRKRRHQMQKASRKANRPK